MTFHRWLIESVLFTPYATIGSQEPLDLKGFLTGGLKFQPQRESFLFPELF